MTIGDYVSYCNEWYKIESLAANGFTIRLIAKFKHNRRTFIKKSKIVLTLCNNSVKQLTKDIVNEEYEKVQEPYVKLLQELKV